MFFSDSRDWHCAKLRRISHRPGRPSSVSAGRRETVVELSHRSSAFRFRLRRISACTILGVLPLSQSCGLIGDSPNRLPGARGVSVPPSGSVKSTVLRPEPSSLTRETPQPAKIPPSREADQGESVEEAPFSTKPLVQTGVASWYGPGFHGKLTASGEVFDQEKFTAAHRTLPWGSKVRVTNLANGKSAVVRINDRGPAVKGRIIDVSKAAATALGMTTAGTTAVRLEWLAVPDKSPELSKSQNNLSLPYRH
jgi:rare lipoprotein A